MEADINGPQRKTVMTRVAPVKAAHGSEGIALRDGVSLPFEVARSWSAPMGYYPEQWFLVKPDTKEILYESHLRTELMRGLQAPTELTDVVGAPLELAPGPYLVVFALGGLKGGEITVTAAEAPTEQAA